MRIEGRVRVSTAPPRAWERINDPDAVRRCTPGLEKLEEVAPDRFDAVLDLALPAIRGRFTGSVEFLERREPEHLRMRAQGRGAPGHVRGEVALCLAPADGGTEFCYAADVQVGGPIARLGQRMISGVAKEMAGQFFEAFDRLDRLPEGARATRSPFVAFLRLLWRAFKQVVGFGRG